MTFQIVNHKIKRTCKSQQIEKLLKYGEELLVKQAENVMFEIVLKQKQSTRANVDEQPALSEVD